MISGLHKGQIPHICRYPNSHHTHTREHIEKGNVDWPTQAQSFCISRCSLETTHCIEGAAARVLWRSVSLPSRPTARTLSRDQPLTILARLSEPSSTIRNSQCWLPSLVECLCQLCHIPKHTTLASSILCPRGGVQMERPILRQKKRDRQDEQSFKKPVSMSLGSSTRTQLASDVVEKLLTGSARAPRWAKPLLLSASLRCLVLCLWVEFHEISFFHVSMSVSVVLN